MLDKISSWILKDYRECKKKELNFSIEMMEIKMMSPEELCKKAGLAFVKKEDLIEGARKAFMKSHAVFVHKHTLSD